MKKLDRSALRLIGGLTDKEIDTMERSSARQRSKKKAPRKQLNPGQQCAQTEIFSGDGSVDMWNEINKAKTCTDLRLALYTVCCRIQELESLVRSNIKR
jgi:hypothetical protein